MSHLFPFWIAIGSVFAAVNAFTAVDMATVVGQVIVGILVIVWPTWRSISEQAEKRTLTRELEIARGRLDFEREDKERIARELEASMAREGEWKIRYQESARSHQER